MEIRNGQPALALMEEREPPIEEDFIGDKRLVRA
jgi:hypothetical protein